MDIVITNPAKSSLRKLYNYYKKDVSKKLADRIKLELLETILKLESHPYIGQIEEQLVSLNLGHRYLVNGHYKIIYRIEKNRVYITDFFDTRQNPSKVKG